jgi:hypothetical protein
VGKIMKMGNTFDCFMRKKTVFSQVLQLSASKSNFFYLEFHFIVKTKLVKNFVSFPMTIFNFFFYQDLICQFDNCLTLCSLNMKVMIISYFFPQQCIYY